MSRATRRGAAHGASSRRPGHATKAREPAPPLVLVHGGAGSSSAHRDGCLAAAAAGLAALGRGVALDGAIAAAVVMEDDGRFNAGLGALLRLDGNTVEMDAGLMDSRGHLAAVAAVRRVKNPIVLAREVLRTPHWMLAGEGADRFASLRGLARRPGRPARQVRERYARLMAALRAGRSPSNPRWRHVSLESVWNYRIPLELAGKNGPQAGPRERREMACDTIGAVARDRRGGLAVTNSTGGASPMMLGRIGDSPIVGAGFYATPGAAVASTGIGEEIVRRMLALRVHDWIVEGVPVQESCERGIALFPASVDVGVIALSPTDHGVAANRDMAWGLVT